METFEPAPKREDALPEEEIRVMEARLSHLRPSPGPRFYQRMASAPWTVPDQPVRWPGLFRRSSLAAAAMTLAGLVLVLSLAFAFEPVRAVAMQVMHYFYQESQDQQSVQLTSSPEVFGSAGYFALSPAEAGQQAGMQVQMLTPPNGMTLLGAHVDTQLNAVVLWYAGSESSLYLTQRRKGNVEEVSSIGASAPVQHVTVHGVPGEYVSGGWKVISSSASSGKTSSTPVVLSVYWDPDLEQSILRWEENGTIFELLSSGKQFDSETLIQIADSIK